MEAAYAMTAESVALPPPTIADAYGHGWNVLKRRWPKLLLLGLILFAISIVGAVIQFALDAGRGDGSQSLAGGLLSFLYNLLVVGPVGVGYSYAYLRAVRGEEPMIDDLFAPFRRNYLAAVVAPFLVTLIVGIGFLLLVIPGIFLLVRLVFATFLVVDEGRGPIEAIAESWRRTEGHFWSLLGGGLLGLVVLWVGVILLLVGVIPAAMWMTLAYATMYASVTQARRGPRPIGS